MDRRPLLGGALAALVLLAGCSWVAQQPTPTSSTSPQSSGDGLTVPQFRLENHTQTLADRSYAVEMRINVSTASTRIDRYFTVRSNPATERQRIELRGSRSVTDRYVTNGTVYTQFRANGSVAYDVRSAGSGNDTFAVLHQKSVSADRLAGIYQFGSFNETGEVTRNGRTLTVFELTETGIDENATIESASGRVLIDRRGIIRLARVDITGSKNGTSFFVHSEYRVLATGNVTVARPDWLDAARRNATTGTATATPDR